MAERYEGPIEPGMRFVWEPDKPMAYEHVTVSKITERDGERVVWSIGSSTRRAAGQEVPNDEHRFREAVRPLSPRS